MLLGRHPPGGGSSPGVSSRQWRGRDAVHAAGRPGEPSNNRLLRVARGEPVDRSLAVPFILFPSIWMLLLMHPPCAFLCMWVHGHIHVRVCGEGGVGVGRVS